MAIPSTTAPVKPQDFTLSPLKVNKQFSINNLVLADTGSGYNLVEGYYTKRITPIGAPQAANDPKNSIDGSYKHVIWRHIDHLYYRDAYTPGYTLEHSNRRYADKFLNLTASYLSMPYLDYGEKIKPNSITIRNTAQNLTVIDDGEGNIYDATLESKLPNIPNNNTIAYWGWNDIFRQLKTDKGTVSGVKYQYDSFTFSPYTYKSDIFNTYFEQGLSISGSKSGMTATFKKNAASYGYVLTPNKNEFNFDSDDEFTLSFWIRPEKQNTTGSVISKNGVLFKNQYGKLPKVNSEGTVWPKYHTSSSYVEQNTDVYPFDLSWTYKTGPTGKLTFTRTDGSRVSKIQLPVSASQWSHVSIVRYDTNSSAKLKMFVNGNRVTGSVTDSTVNPMNDFALLFGSRNRLGANSFSGSLDEVRFVNKAFYSSSVIDNGFYNKLANPDFMYNTSVIGNAFYRSGNIVVSPLHPKYKNILSGSYTISYKGTHTVYQYEVLCRIRKGDFNTTLNPTALRSAKSDLFINDITGSLLKPYATSIGMYNDKGDLVAIGKLGQPIQMRDDVDLNILVRWDG
jgi:hypothetical protein